MTEVTQNGYRLQPYTLAGAPLAQIVGYTGLQLAYGERNPGVCIVHMADTEMAAQSWPPFTMLEVYRTVEGITYLEGDRIWYLLDQEDFYTAEGQRGKGSRHAVHCGHPHMSESTPRRGFPSANV